MSSSSKRKKVLFRGFFFRGFSVSRDTSGVGIVASCSADWTGPLREAMEWEDFTENVGMAKLDGRLLLESILVEPPKDFAKYEINLGEAEEAVKFSFHRTKNPKGTFDHEVRFDIVLRGKAVGAALELYMDKVGEQPSVMTATCGQEEEQTEIDAGAEPVAEVTE